MDEVDGLSVHSVHFVHVPAGANAYCITGARKASTGSTRTAFRAGK